MNTLIEGDKIICINNDHSEEYLTVGKEYTIINIPGKDYDKTGIICDMVQKDNGIGHLLE